MIQKNINFDLVNKLQGCRPVGQIVHVELSHDKARLFYPLGMPCPDNPIPNQRFPTAHPERNHQSAAVFGNRFHVEEKANGRVRPLRDRLVLVKVHPPEIFQPGAFVLMECEIALLQFAADFLPDFHMRAGAYPEILSTYLENLILQVRAASKHPFFVSVRVVAQRRSRGQNNQVSRFDELIVLSTGFLVLSPTIGRVPEHLAVSISQFSQRRRYLTEGRTIPNLERLGFFCATQRHRICKTVVVHRFLLLGARDTTESQAGLKGQATKKLQIGNEIYFRHKARNRSEIRFPLFKVICQSLAHEDDQAQHPRLSFNSRRQLACQMPRPEGQGDKQLSPQFRAGCFRSRDRLTHNQFRRF